MRFCFSPAANIISVRSRRQLLRYCTSQINSNKNPITESEPQDQNISATTIKEVISPYWAHYVRDGKISRDNGTILLKSKLGINPGIATILVT